MTRYSDGRRIALYTSIGRAIFKYRREAGLSLDAVASKVGITSGSLHHYEDGQCCPVHVLVSLADLFDCTLDDLVPVQAEVS